MKLTPYFIPHHSTLLCVMAKNTSYPHSDASTHGVPLTSLLSETQSLANGAPFELNSRAAKTSPWLQVTQSQQAGSFFFFFFAN